ncbi:cryptic protein-like [Lissotriton helveticus]
MRGVRLLLALLLSCEAIHPGQGCQGDNCIKEEDPDSHNSSAEKLKRTLDAMGHPRGRAQHRLGADIAPTGPSYGNTPNMKCCENGGTCFLGSFCICPKHFSGRHCEHDIRATRSCGVLAHGQWVMKGCSWCRCGYGVLHCFQRAHEENCGSAVETGNALHSSSDGPRPRAPIPFLAAPLIWLLLCLQVH